MLESFADRIVATRRIPGREGSYADVPRECHPVLRSALERVGIRRLYSHQAEAFERSLAGENVVITTGTASGKSLAYLLPVLQRVLEEPAARALLLFPTKALTQDQLRGILDLIQPIGEERIQAGVYDGDTPPAERTRIREKANLVLTNPDMLNAGWLPNHGKKGFSHLFRNVRYIVIDEMHGYRGAFGSHVANLMRRLLRICRHYGSEPRFLCSSATIANPVELAERLCHRPFVHIEKDGSPSAGKTIHFWQPPIDSSDFRKSVTEEMTLLVPELVKERHRTIAFCRSRKETEIVLKESRDRLLDVDGGHDESDLIAGYRGGYTPEERKTVQRDLVEGRLIGVVSTNALELGVDIGSLEIVVQGGFPGTRASFWQQMGRAGRRDHEAHGIVILRQAPTDQFLARDPDWILRTKSEHAVIDRDNLMIQLAHIRAACAELPLTLDDIAVFPDLGEALAVLERAGEVECLHGAYHWNGSAHPAGEFSLRNLDGDRFKIVDSSRGLTLTEMDRPQTYHEAHPRAVYLHDGQQYLVLDLDLVGRVATVTPVSQDYYTEPDVRTHLSIIREQQKKSLPLAAVRFGDVEVEDMTVGYKMLQFRNHQNLGYEVLEEPLPIRIETEAAWIEVRKPVLDVLASRANDYLMGMVHALSACARLLTMAEYGDLAGATLIATDELEGKTYSAVCLHDRHPGGLGFSAKAYDHIDEIVESAVRLARDCSCKKGCPACVGDPRLDRRLVAWALENVFVATPVPEGVKLPAPIVIALPKKVEEKIAWTDIERRFADLVFRAKESARSGAEFLGEVSAVKRRDAVLVLETKSTWLVTWARKDENLARMKRLVAAFVDVPQGFAIEYAVSSAEAEKRSTVKDKLRRRLDDLKGEETSAES